jgi:hypothetical protein
LNKVKSHQKTREEKERGGKKGVKWGGGAEGKSTRVLFTAKREGERERRRGEIGGCTCFVMGENRMDKRLAKMKWRM